MADSKIPSIPAAVPWANGMVLEPDHFLRTDARAAALAHVSGLISDPWPWGFINLAVDATALAGGDLKVECNGVFPSGAPFSRSEVDISLPDAADGANSVYDVVRNPQTGTLRLQEGTGSAAENALPAVRLNRRGGVWNQPNDWSPPALLIGSGHPIRSDLNRYLGALASIGVGFASTLRLPGAENRPAARVISQVATVLAQGVGVIESILTAPAVTPGRIGVEALRLALGARTAAGIFEPLPGAAWNPSDQRGALRDLFRAAEEAAAGVGLPFRSASFQMDPDSEGLVVDAPSGTLLLAVEASQPSDLHAARNWLEGAALAAPDRIQSALTRRVGGCTRTPVERDATLGVSSGPLLALYRVEDDFAWRAGQPRLSLAAEAPPPENTSFSILTPESVRGGAGSSGIGLNPPHDTPGAAQLRGGVQ